MARRFDLKSTARRRSRGRRRGFTGFLPSVRGGAAHYYENLRHRDALAVLDVDSDVVDFTPGPIVAWNDGTQTRTRTFSFSVTSQTRGRFLYDVLDAEKISARCQRGYDDVRQRLPFGGFTDLTYLTHSELTAGTALANAETIRDAILHPPFRSDPAWALAALRLLNKAGGQAALGDLRRRPELGPHALGVLFKLVLGGAIVIVDPAAPLDDATMLQISSERR